MAEISEQRSNSNNEPKVAIITGANTGIGKETAKALFKQNYHIIMACRTEERAIQAIEDIVKAVPDKPQANLEFMKLELDSLQSVREFAQNFLAKNIPLQLLICNAGIMACPFGKTRDGVEQQFGVNHLSHFLLTNLLLDKLKESPSSRIVVVSSKLHESASKSTLHLNLEKLNNPKSYDRMGAYSNSKLCNVLFANELTRRLRKEGVTNVTANSLHPGVVKTELSRNFPALLRALWVPLSYVLLTPEQGAKTTIYVATAPQLEGVSGEYFEKSKKSKATKYGLDEKLAADLWEFSEKLIHDATNAQTENITNS